MERQLQVLQPTEEHAVYRRYSAAAQAVEPALCCPVEYSPELLKAIPAEVLERDYGCGDPTPYVRAGETVLDLGAGGGKLCFIAAQVVGQQGRVIGVDCNTDMMTLARQAAPQVAANLGYANVEFRYGLIQDLRLDLALLEAELQRAPVENANGYLTLRGIEERLRQEQPLVADNSVDCVLSNCVLNLVRRQDRQQLFAEIFRVLKPGGRAAISDIVSDEDVPEELQRDSELWSGCVSGAFREDRFLHAFEAAGFHGIELAKRESQPWRIVDGIEFRSVTVIAHKAPAGRRVDRHQAVVYRGPFKRVEDDAGQVFLRGERMAVCDQTFQRLQGPPYQQLFYPLAPAREVPLDQALPFQGPTGRLREPGVSKTASSAGTDSCCQGGGCCS